MKELEDLRHFYYFLRGELQYTHAPFADIFEKIGDKMENHTGKWLKALSKILQEKGGKSFVEIWEKSIEQNMKKSALKQEDLEELKMIGKGLTHFENLDLYIEQLEYKIQKKREIYVVKGKLYKSFGIMGGVFLVILLL